MASRWAYEALAVTQFKNNRYEQDFFDIEQIGSQSNYKQTFYIPELEKILNESVSVLKSEDNNSRKLLAQNLALLKNEFNSELALFPDLPKMDMEGLSTEKFNNDVVLEAKNFLKALEDKNITIFNLVRKKKNNLITSLEKEMTGKENYLVFYDNYYNDFLSDIVKKAAEKNKIIRDKDRLLQNYEPIFHYPVNNGHSFSLRAHFFSPAKYIFGIQVETLYFNLIIIWLMSVVFYITLYYDILKKIIELSGRKGRIKKNTL